MGSLCELVDFKLFGKTILAVNKKFLLFFWPVSLGSEWEPLKVLVAFCLSLSIGPPTARRRRWAEAFVVKDAAAARQCLRHLKDPKQSDGSRAARRLRSEKADFRGGLTDQKKKSIWLRMCNGCSPVGVKGDLSLYCCFFAQGLKQMEVSCWKMTRLGGKEQVPTCCFKRWKDIFWVYVQTWDFCVGQSSREVSR